LIRRQRRRERHDQRARFRATRDGAAGSRHVTSP
jgi:hypothetical protein